VAYGLVKSPWSIIVGRNIVHTTIIIDSGFNNCLCSKNEVGSYQTEKYFLPNIYFVDNYRVKQFITDTIN